MADFEPPSFSLGLDLDFDSEPETAVRERHSSKQVRQSSTTASLRSIEDDDDFELLAMDRDPQVSDQPRTLKRLRRGTTTQPTSAGLKPPSVGLWCNVDDEIEEFSSQEDQRRDEPPSIQYHSVCSSSKFPLHGHGVLSTQSATQCNARKKKQVSDAPASANMETSSNKLLFPKLTVSPLRRFQLIDSDSDDPSVSEGAIRETNKVDSSNLGKHATSSQHTRSVRMPQTQDLWKDFCSEKSFHIPTPALDEVCEEYYRSMKDKSEAQNNNKGCHQNSNISKNDEQQWNLGDPLPPSHRYFFHDDPSIQKLVRSRLPNFFPLGAIDNRGYNQLCASVIDYMGQFSHGEGSRQAAGKNTAEKSSTRSRKNAKKSNAEDLSHGTGSWVNPKRCARIPKDAGKRRVHAVGQSAGHWYTGQDGRRVYVTKNGQELTGQIAYRHYRKESGSRFKKSKKKTTAKKK